jgi:hypothetical protein
VGRCLPARQCLGRSCCGTDCLEGNHCSREDPVLKATACATARQVMELLMGRRVWMVEVFHSGPCVGGTLCGKSSGFLRGRWILRGGLMMRAMLSVLRCVVRETRAVAGVKRSTAQSESCL